MNILSILRAKAKSCKNATTVFVASSGAVLASAGMARAESTLLTGLTFDSVTLMAAGAIVIGATFAVFGIKKVIGLFQGR